MQPPDRANATPFGARAHGWLVRAVQLPRIWWYRMLSDNAPTLSGTVRRQPVMFTGAGRIIVGSSTFGVWPSPGFFEGVAHVEARSPRARVVIGDRCWFNNRLVVIAEETTVSIGDDVLAGTDVTIYDSDFHDLHPARRRAGTPATAAVTIGNNVFLGSHVTILKGVEIGANAVVASGSVVVSSIPADAVAAGVPARIVGSVPPIS